MQISNLEEENEILEDCIEVILPKAEYCESVLECQNAIPVTVIAKDYGLSPSAFNNLLRELKIQYKVSGIWVIRDQYSGLGYTKSVTFRRGNEAIVFTAWTQLGRIFLYDILEYYGIYPTSEIEGDDSLC